MPRSRTSWLPGRSGNPAGFPKALRDVRDAARAHTAQAVATLADIMLDRDSPPAARIAAAEALLDRGWGKAPQAHLVAAMDLEADSRSIELWTTAELEKFLAIGPDKSADQSP